MKQKNGQKEARIKPAINVRVAILDEEKSHLIATLKNILHVDPCSGSRYKFQAN